MKLVGTGLLVEPRVAEYGDVEIDLNFRRAITGRITWFDLVPNILMPFVGEAMTGTLFRAEAEPHQVPVEPPFEITLAESAVVPSSELLVGDDNRPLVRTGGVPGPDEYFIDGAKIRLSNTRAGSYVYVDYFHADEGSGQTIIIDSHKRVDLFALLAALRFCDTPDGVDSREVILAARRCRIITPRQFFSSPSSTPPSNNLGFEFEIENKAPGDLVIYFPE